jgi:Zn-dependent M28 family amino/carboxypeptidase
MKADKEKLYRDVEYLTGIVPPRNYKNQESLNRAADYIKKEFEKCGSKTEEQTWLADGNEYRNIILKYAPEKSKRLIIGAHYDVCCDQPGADDNASAIAGLLETARLVFDNNPKPGYGIDFVAFSLEEPPFFGGTKMGSHVHAKSLYDSNTDVVGMVCYEMIGYFSDEPGSQNYPTEELARMLPDVADFIAVVGISEHQEFNNRFYEQMSLESEVKVLVNNFPSGEGLAGMSDQLNYWRYGYKALMINDTSFLRNPNYHMVTDTIDTLDFNRMKQVVDSTYRAVINLNKV